MEIALNRSSAGVNPPPIGGQVQTVPIPPINPTEANVPLREVIRCPGCQLVQFRTACGRCRRCAKPLQLRLVLVPRLASSGEPARARPQPFPVRPHRPLGPFLLRESRLGKPKIGGQLVRLRKKRGLSQTELARRTGIPRSYVSRMENDHLTPGPRIVSRLADAVGVAIVDLLSSEPHSHDARLSKDPICSELLAAFSRLQPQDMLAVLAEAQRMLAGSGVTTPWNDSPRRSSGKTKAAVG